MMALRRFALDAFLPLFAGTISQCGRSGSGAPLSIRSDGHYHKDRWLSRHPIGRSAPKRKRLQASPGKHQGCGMAATILSIRCRVKGLGNAPLKAYSRCSVMTGSQGLLTGRQIDRKGSPSGTIPGLNVDIPPMLGDDGMGNRQSQSSPLVRPLALGGKIRIENLGQM